MAGQSTGAEQSRSHFPFVACSRHEEFREHSQ